MDTKRLQKLMRANLTGVYLHLGEIRSAVATAERVAEQLPRTEEARKQVEREFREVYEQLKIADEALCLLMNR